MKHRLTPRHVESLEARDKPYEVWDDQIVGLLIRCQPSGKRTFYFSYRTHEGRRNRIRLGPSTLSRAIVVRQAKIYSAQVARGLDPAADIKLKRQAVKVMAVSRLGDFLEYRWGPWALGATGNNKNPVPNVRGAKGELARLKARFKNLLTMPMEAITIEVIDRWRTERLNQRIKKTRRHKSDAPTVSPETINRDCQGLRAVIARAVVWNVIPANPLQELRPLATDKTKTVKRRLTPDEETRLRECLRQRDRELKERRVSGNRWRTESGKEALPELEGFADHLEPLFLVALGIGVRRTSLFRLRWSSVDLGTKTIVLPGTDTKSGQTLRTYANDEVHTTLERWRTSTARLRSLERPGADADLIFPSPRTGRALASIGKSWIAVMDKAGVKDVCWHSLRHEFASSAADAGVSIVQVRDLMGHSSITTTERYFGVSEDQKRAAIKLKESAQKAVSLSK